MSGAMDEVRQLSREAQRSCQALANLKGEPRQAVEWPADTHGCLDRIGPAQAERLECSCGAPKHKGHRGGGHVVLVTPPLSEERGREPSRHEPVRRTATVAGPEKLSGQPDGAGDPLRVPRVATEAPGPVEVLGEGLHGGGDVAEPHRTPRSMTEHVDAEEAEMVLCSQQPDLDLTEPLEAGVLIDILPGALQLSETIMQVHPATLARWTAEGCDSHRVLVRSDPQVDVSIRPQARLRVEPRRRPPLGQQRLHAGGVQEADGVHDPALMEPCLEGLEPVRLPKVEGCRARWCVRNAKASPGQPPHPHPDQVGSEVGERVGRNAQGRGRAAP